MIQEKGIGFSSPEGRERWIFIQKQQLIGFPDALIDAQFKLYKNRSNTIGYDRNRIDELRNQLWHLVPIQAADLPYMAKIASNPFDKQHGWATVSLDCGISENNAGKELMQKLSQIIAKGIEHGVKKAGKMGPGDEKNKVIRTLEDIFFHAVCQFSKDDFYTNESIASLKSSFSAFMEIVGDGKTQGMIATQEMLDCLGNAKES